MPRANLVSQNTTDTAEKIGQVILSHFGLPSDNTEHFYSEPNNRGLLIALKSEEVERRLIVWGADHSTADKLKLSEELKLLLDTIPAAERSIVLSSLGLMDRPSSEPDPGLPITSVFDLSSVFADPEPVSYLIEPEIAAQSVVYLAGAPESGKSTLACAWGRDLVAKGHGVLLLDRDRNPRAVIRNRLERLGVKADDLRFRVWDSRQKSEPPQPDSPVVIEWVRRMFHETGKGPLVIVDSAVSFFLPGEDENSSRDVRALFNRCRAVVDAGGSVLLLHHPGKGGDLRGSSDFGAAADQGFIITNHQHGKHKLSRLILKVHKTRYGLSSDLTYNYREGRMVREFVDLESVRGAGPGSQDEANARRLTELLRATPGVGSREFESIAHENGVPHHRVRQFLKERKSSGEIRVERIGAKLKHFLGTDSKAMSV